MKYIKLTGRFALGKTSIVDDENFEWLNQWKWYLPRIGYPYRCTSVNKVRITIKLHRFIMNFPKNKSVDHINGDRLDNRKSNLRICTRKQNSYNRFGLKRYKGVYINPKKNGFLSSITVNYKTKYIGYFKTELEAALAYNVEAKKYFGEFAKLNSIE